MSRPLWFVELIKKTFSQRFLLAKTTSNNFIGNLIDRLLFEGDDIIFLPKDKVVEIKQNLESPDQTVLPSKVVDHFIEQASYHWIMDRCICRDASDCKDYPHDLGCLFLGEAALGINPGLGRRVSREEAFDHVRKCREAGLVHLIGRNKLDTVWLNVGPGDKLLTICNCCPCCCLWRILPDLDRSISHKIDKMPGVKVTVTDKCSGCGECIDDVCFADAISMVDGRAFIGVECRGCARCVEACPNDAIEITIDENRYVAETINRLAAKVDVK